MWRSWFSHSFLMDLVSKPTLTVLGLFTSLSLIFPIWKKGVSIVSNPLGLYESCMRWSCIKMLSREPGPVNVVIKLILTLCCISQEGSICWELGSHDVNSFPSPRGLWKEMIGLTDRNVGENGHYVNSDSRMCHGSSEPQAPSSAMLPVSSIYTSWWLCRSKALS